VTGVVYICVTRRTSPYEIVEKKLLQVLLILLFPVPSSFAFLRTEQHWTKQIKTFPTKRRPLPNLHILVFSFFYCTFALLFMVLRVSWKPLFLGLFLFVTDILLYVCCMFRPVQRRITTEDSHSHTHTHTLCNWGFHRQSVGS
jgi:hypothetical protein